MNDDLFSHDFKTRREAPEQRDNLFLWTILILLLIGLAFACWLGSFYIFGHPEKPDSYRILQKLHKLDPPKRFEIVQAPAGEFLTPQKAYERYSAMSRLQLEHENEALVRDYINNYQATKRLVPYLIGRYTIMSAYELKNSDFIASGVVAVAQSVDFPQSLVEHVYPAPERAVPILQKMLGTGLDIKLEKSLDLSAIIRVARLYDGRLQFTLMPLLYGTYALKDGSGSFSLEPPPILNPAGGLPIVRDRLLDDALKTYGEFTRKRVTPRATAGGAVAAPVAQSAAQTTIVQLDAPPPAASPSPSPSASAKPTAVAIARETPVPARTPRPDVEEVGKPEPETTPPKAVAAATPPAESTPPPAVETATPAPAPGVVITSGSIKVPLVPFLVSSPTPGTASAGSWRLFPPGRMPRGRLIAIGETGELADRGTGGERLYLRGNFVVTAVVGSKATLRPNSGALASAFATVTRRAEVRVIVEFPAGTPPPSEQASVSRDELRPFEVREVRRSADGQINVFVREVTTE